MLIEEIEKIANKKEVKNTLHAGMYHIMQAAVKSVT
jgi:hypothetical protein